MQQCFDSPVDLNLNEDNLKMATILKAYGYDRQKHNPGLEWTFDGAEQDIIDGIAGVKNINSPVMLVS